MNTATTSQKSDSEETQLKPYYPPEWAPQTCTWLAYPHNFKEWAERGGDSECGLEQMRKFTDKLIAAILEFQDVALIFPTQGLLEQFRIKMQSIAESTNAVLDYGSSVNALRKLRLHVIPNNDIWIRDFGPFFVYQGKEKQILDFAFNAWGEKFPPWDLDDELPTLMATELGLKAKNYPMILEGGSLEFNGVGLVLTTEQCLLNNNRNPAMSREEIEVILKSSLGLDHVIWLKRGLEGDHTDGHIDDFARFISEDTLVLCQAESESDPNYEHLRESKRYLESWRHPKTAAALKIIEIPLPRIMFTNGVSEPLPCSYANFIFVNGGLIVPVFNCAQDEIALDILRRALPDRKIVALDGSFLIEGGGGIHCMSKQEPV